MQRVSVIIMLLAFYLIEWVRLITKIPEKNLAKNNLLKLGSFQWSKTQHFSREHFFFVKNSNAIWFLEIVEKNLSEFFLQSNFLFSSKFLWKTSISRTMSKFKLEFPRIFYQEKLGFPSNHRKKVYQSYYET
jgi:hypothetical protein